MWRLTVERERGIGIKYIVTVIVAVGFGAVAAGTSGCSDDPETESQTETDAGVQSDADSPDERGLLECEAEGFPCSLDEIDDEVLADSQDIGEEVLEMFVDGADRQAVIDHLGDVDAMVEVRAGRHTVAFRLEDSRRVWVIRPDSPMAVSGPAPDELTPTPVGEVDGGSPPGAAIRAFETSDHQDVAHRPGAPRDQKRALLLAPYADEHGGDERIQVARRKLQQTPGYEGNIDVRRDDEVGVEDFFGWQAYDFVHLATHGDTLCIDDDGVATQRLGPGGDETEGGVENCASLVSLGIRFPRTAREVEYQWEVLEQPADSELDLSDESGATVVFAPDVVGEYRIEYRMVETGSDCQDDQTYSLCIESGDAPGVDDGDESFACPEDAETYERGTEFEISGEPPPVEPDGDQRAALYEEIGLDLFLIPRGIETSSPTTEACHSQGACDFTWRVSAGPEFFATHYGPDNPLENTVIYFDGCKTAYTDPLADGLAEQLWGPSNVYLGWDENSVRVQDVDNQPADVRGNIDINTELFNYLREGRSVSYALESLGEDRTQHFEWCESDDGELHTLDATLQASMGRDLRIREILTPYDYQSSRPIDDGFSLESLAADDDDERIRFSVRVDGIDTDDDLSEYVLRVSIDGEERSERWALDGDDVRTAGDGDFFVDVELSLGEPVAEMPDPTTLAFRLDLPDDDGYSEVEFDAPRDCRFPGGTYEVIPQQGTGDCPSEAIEEYKLLVSSLEIADSACEEYPFARAYGTSDPEMTPCVLNLEERGSAMRTDRGLEDGEATITADIYDSCWSPREKIDECEHDFTLEFVAD